MNIVVIGSTGRTGRLVLEEGIRRRHAMTAFTRRPDALADIAGLGMVVHGDGRNLEDIRRAIRGQDVVISIVAPEGRGPTTVVSDVARAELTATLLDLAEDSNHLGEVLLVSEGKEGG